jgi:hypothetical protein
LVIGIYSDSDTKALEDALTAQQIDPSKITVVSSGVEENDHPWSSFIRALRSEDSSHDDLTEGTGILAETGTGVPGLTRPLPQFDSFEHRGNETKHYLADYPVPDDEVENFDDAIAEGRAVVLYPNAGADEPTILVAFKAAGLHNVRAY